MVRRQVNNPNCNVLFSPCRLVLERHLLWELDLMLMLGQLILVCSERCAAEMLENVMHQLLFFF